MTLFQEEAKLAVEPAAGAAIAGMISPLRSRLKNKRVGLIVCGANIDSESYSSFLSRGATNIHKLIEKTEC
jgi:threonine dehydratase